MTSTLLWLRIVLSYCVVGALIVALGSAYFQETNIVFITSIMLLALLIGAYFAEKTRKNDGLSNYQHKLKQQKHLRY